jgi:hypothetical protein
LAFFAEEPGHARLVQVGEEIGQVGEVGGAYAVVLGGPAPGG